MIVTVFIVACITAAAIFGMVLYHTQVKLSKGWIKKELSYDEQRVAEAQADTTIARLDVQKEFAGMEQDAIKKLREVGVTDKEAAIQLLEAAHSKKLKDKELERPKGTGY